MINKSEERVSKECKENSSFFWIVLLKFPVEAVQGMDQTSPTLVTKTALFWCDQRRPFLLGASACRPWSVGLSSEERRPTLRAPSAWFGKVLKISYLTNIPLFGGRWSGFVSIFVHYTPKGKCDTQHSSIHEEAPQQPLQGFFVLDYQDSNLDKQNQNLLCYHYTIVQSSRCFPRKAVQRYRFFPIPSKLFNEKN